MDKVTWRKMTQQPSDIEGTWYMNEWMTTYWLTFWTIVTTKLVDV